MEYGGVFDACDVPSGEKPDEWRSRNRQKLATELAGIFRVASEEPVG
jgi:hypothetical protein